MKTKITEEIQKAIESELEYQKVMTDDPGRPDMIPDFHLGDALSAIQHNLDRARSAWYQESAPYIESMQYLRKIAAIIIRQGEQNGMIERRFLRPKDQ